MTARKLYATIAVASLLFTACDVKDPIHETDHPRHGKITLTTDWSGIAKPSSWTVSYSSATVPVSAESHIFPNLFDPGNYTFYAWNAVDNIAVSGTTATANYASGLLGWLFTGKVDAEVRADADHEFTVVMAQQVRELTLVIEPTGGTVERIETITGTLSGVAGSYDMATGTHGAASDVALTFTKQTTGDHAGKWTATVRLLGVMGAEQKLTGTMTFTAGTPAALPLESGLTAALSGFNADKKTPLTLGGTAVETPTGAGFTATITGWNVIPGDSVIAD